MCAIEERMYGEHTRNIGADDPQAEEGAATSARCASPLQGFV